jgi:hypothetical protein
MSGGKQTQEKQNGKHGVAHKNPQVIDMCPLHISTVEDCETERGKMQGESVGEIFHQTVKIFLLGRSGACYGITDDGLA